MGITYILLIYLTFKIVYRWISQ